MELEVTDFKIVEVSDEIVEQKYDSAQQVLDEFVAKVKQSGRDPTYAEQLNGFARLKDRDLFRFGADSCAEIEVSVEEEVEEVPDID